MLLNMLNICTLVAQYCIAVCCEMLHACKAVLVSQNSQVSYNNNIFRPLVELNTCEPNGYSTVDLVSSLKGMSGPDWR